MAEGPAREVPGAASDARRVSGEWIGTARRPGARSVPDNRGRLGRTRERVVSGGVRPPDARDEASGKQGCWPGWGSDSTGGAPDDTAPSGAWTVLAGQGAAL